MPFPQEPPSEHHHPLPTAPARRDRGAGFEAILAERKAYFIGLYPADQQAAIAATLELESEPVTKLLQENAYRELILRSRINDAAVANMLAWAKERPRQPGG